MGYERFKLKNPALSQPLCNLSQTVPHRPVRPPPNGPADLIWILEEYNKYSDSHKHLSLEQFPFRLVHTLRLRNSLRIRAG